MADDVRTQMQKRLAAIKTGRRHLLDDGTRVTVLEIATRVGLTKYQVGVLLNEGYTPSQIIEELAGGRETASETA